jgi:hypothetical protein
MITMNMNSDEIFKELKRDYQTVLDVIDRETSRNSHKIIKIYQRTKSSVPFKEAKIINVSGNQYRALIVAWPDKGEISSNTTIYSIVENGITGKKNVILFPPFNDNLKSIIVFEAHFMRRYRERYLKSDNMSFEEIVDSFMRSNPIISAMVSDAQKEGEWDLEARLNDGVALGIYQKDTRFFRFITYISDEMLRENQIHLTDDSPSGQVLQIYRKLKDRITYGEAIEEVFKESANIFNGGN